MAHEAKLPSVPGPSNLGMDLTAHYSSSSSSEDEGMEETLVSYDRGCD